ncbi:MAG TPA: hypothetical protein VIE67_13680 [Rudaea sp.]
MTSIVVIVAILGAIFVILRVRNSGERSVEPPRMTERHTPLPAARRDRTMATLHVPDMAIACDLARYQAGKTFEAASAPPLPLPGCSRAACRCHYERVADRRRGQRRSGDDRREVIRFQTEGDRRKNPDRRRSNRPWERKEH